MSSETVVRMIKCAAPLRSLYVTSERMIVAPLQVSLMLPFLFAITAVVVVSLLIFLGGSRQTLLESFIYGGGLGVLFLSPGYILAQRSSWKKTAEKLNWAPSKILEDSKKNFEIAGEVTMIEMSKMTRWRNPTIVVHSKRGNYAFVLHRADVKNQDAIIEDFRKLFGNRLVVK